MNRVLALALLLTLPIATRGASPVLAGKGPLCPDGTWLLLDPSVPSLGEVTLSRGKVAIGTACQITRAKVTATSEGTAVRATAPSCSGMKGRVRLRALIDPTCQQMAGTITNRHAHLREVVSACGGVGDSAASCPALHRVEVVTVGQCEVHFGVANPGSDLTSTARGYRVCAPAHGAHECEGWFLQGEHVVFTARTADAPYETVLTNPQQGVDGSVWEFAGWSADCASSLPPPSGPVAGGRATATATDRDISCTATCVRLSTTTTTLPAAER